MKMNPVKSSNIQSVGYDEGKKVLRVQFRNGGTYDYSDVPGEVHAEILAADSPGAYLAAKIRTAYSYTKHHKPKDPRR